MQRNSHRKESTCLFSSDSLAYPLHTLTFLYQSDPQKAVAFIKTMNNIIQNGRKYKSIFLEKKTQVSILKTLNSWVVVVHAVNPRTREAETGGSL